MKRSNASLLLTLAVSASAMGAGCATAGSGLGEADRLDRQRDGSMAVFLQRKVTDELNVPGGDDVDWKHIDVSESGFLEVGVAFDDPGRVEAEVILRDTFGAVVQSVRVRDGVNFYAFDPIEASPGRYYVELRASKGESVYTIGALVEEPDYLAAPVSAGSPPRESRVRRILAPGPPPSGDALKPPSTRPSEVNDDQGPAEEGDPASASVDAPPDDGPGFITVTGAIQRVTPLEEGGSLLIVSLGGADAASIVAGTSGVINGLGAKVIVRGRSGSIARVFTSIDSEDVRSYKAVTFRVKTP